MPGCRIEASSIYASSSAFFQLYRSFSAHPHALDAIAQSETYSNELTNATIRGGGPGSISPTRTERPIIDSNKKRMLLSLLEALAELQKDSESNTPSLSAKLVSRIKGCARANNPADISLDLKKENELQEREFGFFPISVTYQYIYPQAMEAADEQLQKAGAETFHKFQKFVTFNIVDNDR